MSEENKRSYDELFGEGFDGCLERLGLVQGSQENNWDFRKRAFPEIWKGVSPNLAMDFLLMRSQNTWPKGELRKYLDLLAKRPSKAKLKVFCQEYASDPLIARGHQVGSKNGTDWIAYEIVNSRQPELKKPATGLQGRVETEPNPSDPIERFVVRVVAREFGVTNKAVFARNRGSKCVLARHVAMYLLNDAGLSYNRVGLLFKRDHTTVIHACKKIKEQQKSNSDLLRAIDNIRAELS